MDGQGRYECRPNAWVDLLKDEPPNAVNAAGKQLNARLNEVWKQRRRDGASIKPEPVLKAKPKRRRSMKSAAEKTAEAVSAKLNKVLGGLK